MADATIRDESKRWRVIAVPNPTTGAELAKALRIAEQEYRAVCGRASEWDDTFEVAADDEEITIRFELKEKN